MLTSSQIDSDAIMPENRTGYTYEGKEVVTVRQCGKPPSYKAKPGYYSQHKKVEAATLYCVYGDVEEVARLTDVPVPELRRWRQESWWADIQKQIFIEQNENLSARVAVVLDKAIEQITDRLDNGDQTYNPKTGEITRKPIEAKVLTSLFDSLAHQRRVTRGEPTNIVAKVQVDDRLKQLEEAFLRFSNAKEIDSASDTEEERE